MKKKLVYDFIKRIFDILFSLLSIIVLMPLLIIIVIVIMIDTKGKVLYKQKRLGKNGKEINIYKFRTMYFDADERLNKLLENKKIKKQYFKKFKLKNDPRVTRFGKFLRKYSLDELPQLLSVLKGDMSLVGPRPIIEKEVKKIKKKIDVFLSVKPGLTGWWVVNGHNDVKYKKRIELELYYVNHRNILLDIKIILKTVLIVIGGKGM